MSNHILDLPVTSQNYGDSVLTDQSKNIKK